MLVLTRKTREQIRIGDSITVTILRLKGHAVRVGIEAPHEMRVLRGELVCEDASRQGSARSIPQSGGVETSVGEPDPQSPAAVPGSRNQLPRPDLDPGGVPGVPQRAAADRTSPRIFAGRYAGPLLAIATRRLRRRRAQYMPLGRL